MRLDDYQGYAVFRDPDGLYYAKRILGPCTPDNPWNFAEIEYSSYELEELKGRIDVGQKDKANIIEPL